MLLPAALDPFASRSEPPSSLHESLSLLVHHRASVEADATLAEVQKIFQGLPHEFLAITQDDRVVGLCARSAIGFLLGSRYGFSLYGSRPVQTARAEHPLIYRTDAALPEVLDQALSRTGVEFFEDIVVVDAADRLVGLVPVPALAQLQLQLFDRQLKRVVEQDDKLRRQNLELFQINHQLRQSQGRYKALFENNALGVVLLEPSGAIVAHNRRFEELLLLEQRPTPPQFALEQWIVPRQRAHYKALLDRLESKPASTTPEIAQLSFEFPGGARLFELHCSWVSETGQICAFLEDITDQQNLERQLARQEKQTMLDTLVAGVAHELNNKLTPVLGFAELLEAVAPPALRSHAHCIQQSSREAAQIIKQLLNMARPADADFSLVDLAAICREASQMLRYQLLEHGCEATLRLPDDPVWINGNAAQLKQVLLNLLLNACHAMDGRPRRELTLAVESRPGSAWVRVCDTGVGIPPENLHRIFDPFFTTKGPRGTGLGLSISASLVRQHGGEIQVESVAGQGSTFSLRLPAEAARENQLPAPSRESETSRYDASRRRVLIVDDEEFVRQFMQEALRVCFGCGIETAVDGQDATGKLLAGDYDLILTDIRMPRLDGFQLRAWIAEHRPELAGRVVFVTGHAGSAELDAHLGDVEGAIVIRKPFTIDAIIGACRPYLVAST